MIKFVPLSLAVWSLLSLNVAFAAPEKAAPTSAKPTPEEQLSERLDAFLNEAIEGGLLQSGEEEKAAPAEEQATPAPTKPAEKKISYKCTKDSSLEFSDYSDLKTYEDLTLYVEKYEEDMKAGSKTAARSVARAYMALGLYAEGRLLYQKAVEKDASALVQLSHLLERHNRPDLSFFRAHAACNEDSQIWLAAALLYEGQGEGAEILSRNQTQFRDLPLQLRIDVTTIAIPELDRLHKRDLAKMMFASFDADEIEGASRLGFSQALMDASEGKESIEEVMQEYMLHPEYRAAAAAALIRYNKPVPVSDRDVLLEELVKDLGQSEGGRDIPLKLKIALQQMSALSDYSQLHDLIALPGLQSQQAMAEVRKQFVVVLKDDLDSAEPVRVLAVVEALLSHKDLLQEHSALPELYKASVEFANAQGYLSLAKELGRQYGFDDVVLAADLAYREKNTEVLYALAQEHLDNSQIVLWAALAAIDQNDPMRILKLEDHIPLDIETIIPLIEADALSGNWVVPYAFYVAADELKTEENATKVQQILDLRQRERTGKDRVGNQGILNATEVLEASAASLSEINGGASK